MALQNYIDQVGPVVSALVLNELDQIRNVVTVPVALTSLTVAASAPVIVQAVGNGGLTASFILSSTLPQMNLVETDAAANFGRWRIQAQGQVFSVASLTDAGAATVAFNINRTAGTGVASDVTFPIMGVFTKTRTASLEHALQVTAASVSLSIVETGVAANNGRWSITADGEAFSMFALADNELTGTAFLEVQRSGTTIDTVTLNGQIVLPKAETAGPPTAALFISSTAPAWALFDSDGGANMKAWDCIANANQLNLRGSNDDGTGAADAMVFGRSGATPTGPFFPNHGTTASAANAFLNSGGSPVGQLQRSTSSIRYKTDVQPLDVSDLEKLDSLTPITYRSLCEGDNKEVRWYGLIAEDVAKVLPRLVQYTSTKNGDGVENLVPDGVQYERIVVLLLAKMQQQEQRIAHLEEQLAGKA